MNKKSETNSIAPFVRKTYELVSNPMTDDIVVWGIHNNSFIIFDPMFFSQQVLPAYFKHNNFTSYIRQLNDYGFRKVDPDRWEFANQWFLRGQEELLCNISRKLKCSKNMMGSGYKRELEMEDEQQELRVEVSRLKEKQRQLEEELHHMSRRIEAIETRLEPIMSTLLYKPDRPELLINDGPMLLNGNNKQLMQYNNSDSISSTPCFYNYSTSMAVSSEEEDNWAVGSTNNEVDNILDSCFHTLSTPVSYDKAVEVVPKQTTYPFSLLEGGL